MSAIGKAIGPLVNIALLLLFAIIIFAIIGLEFYAGALNSTCYSLEDLGKNILGLEFYAGALNSTCCSLEDLGKTILEKVGSFKVDSFKNRFWIN